MNPQAFAKPAVAVTDKNRTKLLEAIADCAWDMNTEEHLTTWIKQSDRMHALLLRLRGIVPPHSSAFED